MTLKEKWESTGLMDGMPEYKKDIFAEKLEEISNMKNVVITPAMLYALRVIFDEDITCGDMDWYISMFNEYYNENPTPSFKLEEHDYNIIPDRVHRFLKWWRNKQSMIL